MISTLTLVAIVLSIVGLVALALGLIWLLKDQKINILKPIFLGAMVFIINIFFMSLVANLLKGQSPLFTSLVVALVYAGFSLGIRTLFSRSLLKESLDRSFDRAALAFGAGQTLAESILFVLMSQVSNFRFALMINDGTIFNLVNQGNTRQTVEEFVQRFTSLPWFFHFLLLIQRLGFLFIYGALAWLLLTGLRQKNNRLILLSFGLEVVFVALDQVLGAGAFGLWVQVLPSLVFGLAAGALWFHILHARKEDAHV